MSAWVRVDGWASLEACNAHAAVRSGCLPEWTGRGAGQGLIFPLSLGANLLLASCR